MPTDRHTTNDEQRAAFNVSIAAMRKQQEEHRQEISKMRDRIAALETHIKFIERDIESLEALQEKNNAN